jgi:hypothetical protein
MRARFYTSTRTSMPRSKRCSSCETTKAISAFGRGGADSWCRPCRRDYQRRWLAEHREEYNAKHREYYQRHREELREYNREYQRRRRALMQAGKWKSQSRTSSVSGRRARAGVTSARSRRSSAR